MPPSGPFNPFTSPRLVYRAVRDTPEDESFFHAIQGDSAAQSGSSYSLLRPESLKNSNSFRKTVSDDTLLGAIVCLPSSTLSPEQIASQTTNPTYSTSAPYNHPTALEAGIPIGIVVLKSLPARFAHHRQSEISIDILDGYRGKGYGAEAINWALWYGFQMANLHRIEIQAFGFNEGAIKLYKKLGFVQEGQQRDFMWFNGRWHDNYQFAMLENEWRAKQDEAEGKKEMVSR